MDQRIKGGLLVFIGAASFGLLSTIVKLAYAEGYTLGEITGTQSFREWSFCGYCISFPNR
jgi:hypothetical protein